MEAQDVKERRDTHLTMDETRPTEWDDLHPALKAVLPAEEGLTYVITEFTPLPTEDFHGAPDSSFQATVRVNLSKEEAAKSWMEKDPRFKTSPLQGRNALSASAKEAYSKAAAKSIRSQI